MLLGTVFSVGTIESVDVFSSVSKAMVSWSLFASAVAGDSSTTGSGRDDSVLGVEGLVVQDTNSVIVRVVANNFFNKLVIIISLFYS